MSALFVKKFFLLTVFFLGIAFIALFFILRERNNVPHEFIIALKGDLVQEVSVTGRVKPQESVDLAFENSGKVMRIYVKVGERVSSGEKLLELENENLLAELAKAGASVKAEQARLDELKRGTREEEIQVERVKVSNAKIALGDAKKNLVDKLNDAFTKSDDAVRNKVDQFFDNPRTSNPDLQFSPDSQVEIELELERTIIESTLVAWEASLNNLTTASALDLFAKEARANLDRIKSFLGNIAFAINDASQPISISKTTFDGWKSDVSTARTNINTATSNLSAAEEKLRAQDSNLVLAENELVLKESGATREELAIQEAKVEEVEANVWRYKAEIAKTIIRAPINGIITKQDAKVGEIIAANTAIVAVISDADFAIETNIPEADIAKIHIGDAASLTLDAYGNDVILKANVVLIDPAETIIDGVAIYKATLHFAEEDARIRSGMTANVDIMSARLENVIAIPGRVVITKNGNKFVRILEGVTIKEVPVQTGLRGSNGDIEIIDGVNEGDRVITFSRAE